MARGRMFPSFLQHGQRINKCPKDAIPKGKEGLGEVFFGAMSLMVHVMTTVFVTKSSA